MTEALVEKQTGIELVLNGGTSEMNSPTVPVTWVFNEETIAEGPVYLLFVEQHEHETDVFSTPSRDCGRRYACKVDRGVQFIPVFRPGLHRLAVLAFPGESKKKVQDCLHYHGKFKTCFSQGIVWSYLEDDRVAMYGAIAAAIVEFEVPEALFEAKPRTRFWKHVWDWVNWLHEGEPRDQCQYRRRAIIAFSCKWVPGVLLCVGYAIMQSIILLWSFVGPVGAFLFGFRPRNPFVLWRESQKTSSQEPNCAVYEYPEYRLWNDGRKSGKRTRMPIAPIELLLAIGGPVLVWHLFLRLHFGEFSWLTLAVGVGIAVAMVAASIALFVVGFRALGGENGSWYLARQSRHQRERVRRAQEQEQREHAQEQKRAEQQRLYLTQHFRSEHKPEAVDLSRIPPAQNNRVAQRFYVGWWALKARVCRPYAK